MPPSRTGSPSRLDPLSRSALDGDGRRRRRRRRDHGLLVCPRARRGRHEGATLRRAGDRRWRKRPERRLRAARWVGPVPGARESRSATRRRLRSGAGPRPSWRDLAALAGDAFRSTGSLRLAADEEERDELREEYEALVDAGFAAEWREDLAAAARRPLSGGALSSAGRRAPAGAARSASRAACGGSGRRDPRAHAGPLAWSEARREDGRRCDGRLSERPPRRARRAHRPDAWPGDRDRADRGDALRDPALRAARLRLLASAPGRQDRRGRLSRRVARHRVHGGRSDDAGRPGRRSSDSSRSTSGGRFASTTAGPGSSGWCFDFLPVVGPRPRDGGCGSRRYSGHGNVLGFACGRLVARRSSGRTIRSSTLFEPARLLVALTVSSRPTARSSASRACPLSRRPPPRSQGPVSPARSSRRA